MNFIDYFKILGVSINSSDEEIKSAYRKLSKKFHPDLNNNDKFFEERFKEIQEAYEVLTNTERKKKFIVQYNAFYHDQTHANKMDSGFDNKTNEETNSNTTNNSNRQKEESTFKENSKVQAEPKKNFKAESYIFVVLILVVFGLIRHVINKKITSNTISDYHSKYQAHNASSQMLDTFSAAPAYENDTILIINDKTIKIKDIADEYKTSSIDFGQGSTSKMLVEYYTGGAHCCFVYNLFDKIDSNVYKLVFEFTGGEQSFNIINNSLQILPYEQIGYFYSCYACNIVIPNSQFVPQINMNYINSKFYLACDTDLNITIIRDLIYLKNKGIPPLDDDMDDGTRKAYAGLIITYYFNNRSNFEVTRDLFMAYYEYYDREQVWDSIVQSINSIFSMDYTTIEYLKRVNVN